jgi:hypothetical protein
MVEVGDELETFTIAFAKKASAGRRTAEHGG